MVNKSIKILLASAATIYICCFYCNFKNSNWPNRTEGFILPPNSFEITNNPSLVIEHHLPDSSWSIKDDKGEKLNCELASIDKILLQSDDYAKKLFAEIEHFDSVILYHFTRGYNNYYTYCEYDLDWRNSIPSELFYPDDIIPNEAFDEVVYPLDRYLHKYIRFHQISPSRIICGIIDLPYKNALYSITKFYIYVPQRYPDAIYVFNGDLLGNVIDNFTAFRAGYNNYAIQIESKVDFNAASEIYKDDTGTLYRLKKLDGIAIQERIIEDPYLKGHYRVIGKIPGHQLSSFKLYDDSALFSQINVAIQRAYKNGLIEESIITASS